jgi:hypothetical protein
MGGGQLEVAMTLTFGAKSLEGDTLPEWSTQGTFHEADIQVDAILSYPWLKERFLGVFPHLEALAILEEPLLLLQSYASKEEGDHCPETDSDNFFRSLRNTKGQP